MAALNPERFSEWADAWVDAMALIFFGTLITVFAIGIVTAVIAAIVYGLMSL